MSSTDSATPRAPHVAPASPARRPLAALTLVGLCLLMSMAGAVVAYFYESNETRTAFKREAQDLAWDLQTAMDSRLALTAAVGRFSLESPPAGPEGFSLFCRGAVLAARGTMALAYVERAPDGALRVRDLVVQEGGPDAETTLAPGRDLGRDDRLRPVLERAAATAAPLAKECLAAQDGPNPAPLLVFAPVYGTGTPPATEPERLQALIGFGAGVFRYDGLMEQALAHHHLQAIAVRLTENVKGRSVTLAQYQHGQEGAATPREQDLLSASFPMNIPGRDCTLVVQARPDTDAASTLASPILALLAGLAVTALLALNLFKNQRMVALIHAREKERASAARSMQKTIAALQEAEAHYQENEQKLRLILSGIKAATLTIDPVSFNVLDMNEIAAALVGVPREAGIGRNHREILGKHLRLLDAPDSPISEMGDGLTSAEGEYLLQREDGRLIPVARTILATQALGRSYLFEILFDITEKKALERQLGLAQKLESIGQLASGIAHEINTPIQYVSGNLGFLRDAFAGLAALLERHAALEQAVSQAPDQLTSPLLADLERTRADTRSAELLREIPDSIEDSIAGVERVAAIVGAMKRFSHPETAGKRLLDVNKAIESTLTISRNEWKYTAEMVTDLDPDLPLLLCHPGDFNQAILNVVVNAAHAVADRYAGRADKGRISVTTRKDGDSVRISIADTGIGIPKENLPRIFDPFFTTKEVGKGTGQGLAIVHSVVTRHGGSVALESEPGQGTTFHLRFPIQEEARQ